MAVRECERVLVAGARLVELARLVVITHPDRVRPEVPPQIDVERAGLVASGVVARRELVGDPLFPCARRPALAVGRLVEGARGARGRECRGKHQSELRGHGNPSFTAHGTIAPSTYGPPTRIWLRSGFGERFA